MCGGAVIVMHGRSRVTIDPRSGGEAAFGPRRFWVVELLKRESTLHTWCIEIFAFGTTTAVILLQKKIVKSTGLS